LALHVTYRAGFGLGPGLVGGHSGLAGVGSPDSYPSS